MLLIKPAGFSVERESLQKSSLYGSDQRFIQPDSLIFGYDHNRRAEEQSKHMCWHIVSAFNNLQLKGFLRKDIFTFIKGPV